MSSVKGEISLERPGNDQCKLLSNLEDVRDCPKPAKSNMTLNQTKKSPKDFIFGKLIGEGSFSMVYLAKDIHSNKEYAIKVCEKRHILREKKQKAIMREKHIMNILNNHPSPFFIRLYCTFQDNDRLYFVMNYAKHGELLPYIIRVGSFDEQSTRFYSAELVSALEHLQKLNIIHRDLKPENILLTEGMHIQITDFGSAKVLSQDDTLEDQRKNSFVGTAQYVSPEMLTDKCASTSSDLWALGCIIYQMMSGLPPFRATNEYLIFQKITKLEYDFPDGFLPLAKDLVQQLLVLDPNKRLGAIDSYKSLREHPFFDGCDWTNLAHQTPPRILPYLPGTSNSEELRSQYEVPDHLEPGLDDKQMTRLLGLALQDEADNPTASTASENSLDGMAAGDAANQTALVQTKTDSPSGVARTSTTETPILTLNLEPTSSGSASVSGKKPSVLVLDLKEFERRLVIQGQENPWHKFVENNLILKQGLVDKRKGLFARRRMLLLTTGLTGPHLYYVDPVNQVLKGQIPWSTELRTEPKNFKTFFVHTPNRTYYLDDPEGYSLEWCRVIDEVLKVTYTGQS